MQTQYFTDNKKAKSTVASWQGREVSSLTLVYWSLAAALGCFLVNFMNLAM